MTDQYTYPPPVSTYPGPGATPLPPPTPSMPQFYPAPAPRKRKGGLIAAVVGGAAIVALTAGVVGGLIGNHMAGNTAASAPPAATPSAPTAEQVNAATVDLCTRFAAGYRAMPSPQKSSGDILPSYNYISEALNANPNADNAIRDAVAQSLKMARDQISNFSDQPRVGAIEPSKTWTAEAANAVDQHAWDLCKAYGG
ncbi:hypothetical protein [Mycolicibacterium aromaticivorans]|uniref:hypothetical protein n=1 Tax=Mycolicibacterium aromaticivorans TaxID=318425 RepID=UPI00103BD942|nr:hypothetical protein [Mycolicibacterium aromaticivorans]